MKYVWVNGYWWIYRACANHLCSTLYIISLTFTEASVLAYVHYRNEPEMFLGFCIAPGVQGQGDGRSSTEKWFSMEELKTCYRQHWGYSEHPGGKQIYFKSSHINTVTSGPDSTCLGGKLMSDRTVLWADIYSSLSNVSDKVKPSPQPKSSYVCFPWACTPFLWINLANGYISLMTPLERKMSIVNSS